MKKILLTGCMGQLGLALRTEYRGEVSFILTDSRIPTDLSDDISDEVIPLDISDEDSVYELVDETVPDVIINCAAITNVDGCESDYDTAYKVNALGPMYLAKAADRIEAKLIHISTDYVFRGDSIDPITEDDKPDPISAYGRSKLAGEEFVRECTNKYFIIRTAWLYGDGKNFVRTMLDLSKTKEEISVVDDQIGSPTSASELARIIHALEPTDKYGIYNATCEGSVSWADFAETIFRLTETPTKVIPISSEEYKKLNPASADRPLYSILDNKKLRDLGFPAMSSWEDALIDYLNGDHI